MSDENLLEIDEPSDFEILENMIKLRN